MIESFCPIKGRALTESYNKMYKEFIEALQQKGYINSKPQYA
jgi:ribosomal protein S8